MLGGPAGLLWRLPSFNDSIHGFPLPGAWDGHDLAIDISAWSGRGARPSGGGGGIKRPRPCDDGHGRATKAVAFPQDGHRRCPPPGVWPPPLSTGSEADTLPDGRRGGTRTRPPPRRPAPTPRAHARPRSAPRAAPVPGEAGPGSLSSSGRAARIPGSPEAKASLIEDGLDTSKAEDTEAFTTKEPGRTIRSPYHRAAPKSVQSPGRTSREMLTRRRR